MSLINRTEVLSPAGNKEMLTAAVRSGADAVYLGAKEFSARRNAENFDFDGLKEAVKYCRIRGVKVYLTLNTLIKDSELKAALRLAKTAYDLGVDGIITEDMGLAAAIHKYLPELPLHASTQMSVHTPAALEVLKKMGFCRVVAAREMSKTELEEFCKAAERLEMEVEVFVHGALCMSVSGQCLLSAFLGSRSGNRGLCAGPCRLPFAVKGGTGYDLSLKDLSLLPYLRELERIGVCSFKIEGRMKRPEYVAAATAACRSALDNGFVPEKLENTLKNVFSRSGFTDGYFRDNLGRDMFGIRTKEDVTAANDAFPFIHGIYRAERSAVPITAKLSVKNNEPVSLTLCDGVNTVCVSGDIPAAAQNSPVTEKSLEESISKFGSTPYYLKNTEILCGDGLFVSAKGLNGMRREAALLLDEKRGEIKRIQNNISYTEIKPDSIKRDFPRIYVRVENEEQIPYGIRDIDMLIYPLEKDIEYIPDKAVFAVDIPRFADDSYTEKRLEYFKNKGVKYALCGNIAALSIARKKGFNVIADTGLNAYNSESAAVLSELGAERIILSTEVTLKEAAALNSPVQKGIVAYGKIPLMLFKNCPQKNAVKCALCKKNGKITDRRNTEFKVRCRAGASEMLNSVPIWLADRRTDLKAVDFAVLYFTDEDGKNVKEIINAYKNGSSPKTEYTRGLYYRGTL